MSAPKFGLIGHPLGHSLSPFVHEALLRSAGLPGSYELLDIPPERLPEEVPGLLDRMAGFNCTIPYKLAIKPYLDGLDPTSSAIGAVNTVWRRRGYNTDLAGFQADCPLQAENRVLILGAGGVSRTMAFAAVSVGAETWILARRPEQAEALGETLRQAYPACRVHCPADLSEWLAEEPHPSPDPRSWILLNGTPAGMWPETAGLPFPAELLGRFGFVYDTIFNPPASRLLLAARSRGIQARNGLGMLIEQALAAQRIWHPAATFPAKDLKAIRKSLPWAVLSTTPLNIILIGYMGSGKTTIGKVLAKRLGVPFIDLDESVEKGYGKKIPEIFAEAGEPVFRMLEQEKLAQLLHSGRSLVLATGGGALLSAEAEAVVRNSASLIIYLDVPLETLRKRIGRGKGRPLIYQQGDNRFTSLYLQRLPRYTALADLQVDGRGESASIAAQIAGKLGMEGESS